MRLLAVAGLALAAGFVLGQAASPRPAQPDRAAAIVQCYQVKGGMRLIDLCLEDLGHTGAAARLPAGQPDRAAAIVQCYQIKEGVRSFVGQCLEALGEFEAAARLPPAFRAR